MYRMRFSDRLSNTIVIALWGWLLCGISLLFSPLFLVHDVSPALRESEAWVKEIIAFLLVSGSSLVLVSGKAWPNSTTSWKFELVGLPLLISGWGFYSTSILVINGWTLFPAILGLSNSLACVARLHTLFHEKSVARKRVEIMEEGVIADVG